MWDPSCLFHTPHCFIFLMVTVLYILHIMLPAILGAMCLKYFHCLEGNRQGFIHTNALRCQQIFVGPISYKGILSFSMIPYEMWVAPSYSVLETYSTQTLSSIHIVDQYTHVTAYCKCDEKSKCVWGFLAISKIHNTRPIGFTVCLTPIYGICFTIMLSAGRLQPAFTRLYDWRTAHRPATEHLKIVKYITLIFQPMFL